MVKESLNSSFQGFRTLLEYNRGYASNTGLEFLDTESRADFTSQSEKDSIANSLKVLTERVNCCSVKHRPSFSSF